METLPKNSKKLYQEFKNKIIDIVLFGSSAKNKPIPEDIDIAVLLKNTKESELPALIEKFSRFFEKNVHLNLLLIETLLDSQLFKTLLDEGISMLDTKALHQKLGYESGAIFGFNLTQLTKSKKVLFSYALHGKKNSEGMLKRAGGKELGRAVIFIPVHQIDEFKSFFELWNINFYMTKVLKN